MAFSKYLVASLLVSLLLLQLIQADEKVDSINSDKAYHHPYKNIDCGSACRARCALASRQKMCHRACGTCCARCHCVPPGTSGHTAVCPCYATMTTHGGRLKCP